MIEAHQLTKCYGDKTAGTNRWTASSVRKAFVA
jgi:hypothetical protein